MKTVMVVDDSRIMRNIVKNTFSTLNIPCAYVEAGDGEEALRQLAANKVDLILLDWNMPKLSGFEFLKTVRAMEAYKDLPIIMVTREAAKYIAIEAMRNGATDYIMKPVNEKIFAEKLAKLDLRSA
jgi:two-component system chemotaxis response regulator CheY